MLVANYFQMLTHNKEHLNWYMKENREDSVGHQQKGKIVQKLQQYNTKKPHKKEESFCPKMKQRKGQNKGQK